VTGAIWGIPAGIITFAEIVMAGIDKRRVEWKDITDRDSFPTGDFSVSLPPESGISDITENTLREDLLRRVKPPSEITRMTNDVKDDAIARRIKYWFKQGLRTYLMCWIPRSEEERPQYLTQIKGIQKRYPVLAVITLDRRLMGEHQDLFDDIRRLML